MKKLLYLSSVICLLGGFAAVSLVASDNNLGIESGSQAVDQLALADDEKGSPRDGDKPAAPRERAKPARPRDGDKPAGPREGDNPPPPRGEGEKTTVRGVIDHFNKNPEEDIDGIVLVENEKLVRFPPDMGERIAKVVGPKDEIEVQGTLQPGRDGNKRMRIESIKNIKSGEVVAFAPRPRGDAEGERKGPREGDGPRTGPADGDSERKGPREGDGPVRGPQGEAGQREPGQRDAGPRDATQQRRGPSQEETLAEIRSIRALLNLPAPASEQPAEAPPRDGDRQAPPQNRVLKELRELREALAERAASEKDK